MSVLARDDQANRNIKNSELHKFVASILTDVLEVLFDLERVSLVYFSPPTTWAALELQIMEVMLKSLELGSSDLQHATT